MSYAYNWNGELELGVKFSRQKMTLMAGPCMFESYELGLQVALALKQACAQLNIGYIFKSSYDKANRTSDKSMRGPGAANGLLWLQKIRHDLQIPVLTDIHSPAQAIEAGKYVDILQIPAFLCEQESLLAAAASTQKAVQIKKGQHVSSEVMRNAARLLQKHGCHKILLCERGSVYGYNNLVVDYRNLLEMGQDNHAVVFDATHSAQLPGAAKGASSGLRHVIPGLTRAAVAFGIDGLFMEVHPNPTAALSDAATQLSIPEALQTLQVCARIHSAVNNVELESHS